MHMLCDNNKYKSVSQVCSMSMIDLNTTMVMRLRREATHASVFWATGGGECPSGNPKTPA